MSEIHSTNRPPCSADGCDRPVRIRGLCQKHYTQARRAGAFGAKRCAEPGCEAFSVGRGLCIRHHTRARRAGEIAFVPCSVDGCANAAYTRGMCVMHNHRWERHGDAETKLRSANGEVQGQTCAAPGCGQPGRAACGVGGAVYCGVHWKRLNRHGDPLVRKRIPNGTSTPERKRQQIREGLKRYYQTPHGRMRARWSASKRRAMKYGCDSVSGLTKGELLAIYNEPVCGICFRPVPEGERTIDHIIPLGRGGANRIDNLQLAHMTCNQSKGNRMTPVCVRAGALISCRRHSQKGWVFAKLG